MTESTAATAPASRPAAIDRPVGPGRNRRAATRDLAIETRLRVREAGFRTTAVTARLRAFDRLLRDREPVPPEVRSRLEHTFALRGVDAFTRALHRVLVASRFPNGLHGTCAVAFDPWAARLLVECRLPGPSVVPTARAYRRAGPTEPVRALPRPEGEIRRSYAELLARVVLRTVAEAFDAAPVALVTAIACNGYGPPGEPGYGDPAHQPDADRVTRPLLISVDVTRAALAAVTLDDPGLDPVACLRRLGAGVSPEAYHREEVPPRRAFDLSGHRFVEHLGPLAELDDRPDLLTLDRATFGHLVRCLFEATGLTLWSCHEQCRGDVDALAASADPRAGGLRVVRARQGGTVGPDDVAGLSDALRRRSATAGFLVSTTRIDPATRARAAVDPRISLVDGATLRTMLRDRLGLDVSIGPRP